MPTKPAKPPAEAAEAAAPVAKVQLKKREFMDRAAERSGVKKPEVKEAVEATLSLLAEALKAGQEVIVPPLGRIKVTKQKDVKAGKVLMLRLQLDAGDKPERPAKPARAGRGGKAAKDPLAEAAE